MSDRQEQIGEATVPVASVKSGSQAEQLVEGAIRMAEADADRAQAQLVLRIKAEKDAHANVEFWKNELNGLVAKRQELEASLRQLRVLPSVPAPQATPRKETHE